jgi:hypothetical protein
MSSLLQFTYASAATQPFDAPALAELLAHSRERNDQLGISGLLLHRDGNFLQVVEGPPEGVRALIGRIERDPRHRQFTSLLELRVAERLFPDWTMGFEQVDLALPPSWPGLSRFLQDLAPPSNARAERRAPALYFFEVFRTHMR